MGYSANRPDREGDPPMPRGRSGAVHLEPRTLAEFLKARSLAKELLDHSECNEVNVIVTKGSQSAVRVSLLPPEPSPPRSRPSKRAPRSRVNDLPTIYRTEYRVPVSYALLFFVLGALAEWWFFRA